LAQQDAIDAMLRQHFEEALGPRTGTAGKRFALYIDGVTRAPSKGSPAQQSTASPRFLPVWSIGLLGGALAAALSIVTLRHVLVPTEPAKPTFVQNHATPPDDQAAAPVAQRGSTWETYDQGVVELVDGTPAQRLYRRQLDTLRWYDPKRKATIEYATPREETVFVGLNKY